MSVETTERKNEKRIDREPPLPEQLAYSINQVARLTSLSRNTVIAEMNAGKLSYIKRRNRVLILAEAVSRYLTEEPAKTI